MTGVKGKRGARLALIVAAFVAFEVVLAVWSGANIRSLVSSEQKRLLAEDAEAFGRRLDVVKSYAEVASVVPEIKSFLAMHRGENDALGVLQSLKEASGAEFAMLMAKDGTCVLSTSPRLRGNNYGFREYFKDAMARGEGFLVAYGVTSHSLGFYFASRVTYNGTPAGAVVLKLKERTLFPDLFKNEKDKGPIKLLSPTFKGIATNQGIILQSAQGFYTLEEPDRGLLGHLEKTRQFPLRLVHPLGFPRGTWEGLKKTGVLRVDNPSLHGEFYLYAVPLKTGRLWLVSSIPATRMVAIVNRHMVPVYGALGALTLSFMALLFFYSSKEESEKRLKEEIRKQGILLSRYKRLTGTVHDGFCAFDAGTMRITEVNQEFCKILGYEEKELKERNLLELVDEGARERIAEITRQGQLRIGATMHCKDSSTRVVRMNLSLIEEEGTVFALVSDITDLVQVKEEIKRLSTAVEQTDSIVVMTNTKGEIVYVNPAFTRETGYTRDEALGQNPRILKTEYHPPEFYQELWATISSGMTWRGTFKNRAKDGRILWEEAVISPVTDEKGLITGYLAIKNNINEKVELEERLRSTVNQLNLIIENAPIGIAYVKNRTIIRCNGALARFWGGTPEEVVGREGHMFHPTKEQDEMFRKSYQEMVLGKTVVMEVPIKLKDGSTRWARVSGRVLDLDNPQAGSVWMVEDIHERKEWEEVVARKDSILEAISRASSLVLESEEIERISPKFLKLLADAAGLSEISVVRIKEEGEKVILARRTSWSEKGGYTPHLPDVVCRLDGKVSSWLKWLHSGKALNFGPEYPILSREEPGPQYFVPIHIDQRLWGVLALRGQEKWHEIEAEAFKLAANLIASTVKRERMKQERAREEEKNTILVENANSIIVRSSPEGRILFMNRFGCRFFGYEPEEIAGKHLLDTIIPATDSSNEDREETLRRIFENPEKYPYREVENRRSDGTTVWVAWNHIPLRDHNGELVELISIGHDITRQKEIERNLREASRAKSAFVANMSHEMRTPLNVVIGMCQLLADTPLEDEQKGYVHNMYQASKALLYLINDILDLAKIEAGMMEFSQEPFNLLEVVEETTSMFANQPGKEEIEVVCQVDPEVPLSLEGDPQKLGQALRNLLSNSLKFTSKGHVVLSVSKGSDVEDKAEIVFKIIDSGMGIPKEKLGRMFESFYQGDSSITKRFGGTGLGLAITREVVKGMKGRIEIESEDGKGTVFSLFIPLKVRGNTPQRLERLITLARKEGLTEDCRILVSVNNWWTEKAICDMLKRFGLPFESVGRDGLTKRLGEYEGPQRTVVIAEAGEGMDEVRRLVESREWLHLVCVSQDASPCARIVKEPGSGYASVTKPVRHEGLLKAILKAVGCKALVQEETTGERRDRKVRRGTVLVVEDIVMNQRLMRRVVENQGHEVVVASDGVEALKMLLEREIDMVFMDVQMPNMDGITASRVIRACESGDPSDLPEEAKDKVDPALLKGLSHKLKGRHTRIIALTAHAFQEHRQEVEKAGMDWYLSKPVEIAALKEILDRFFAVEDAGEVEREEETGKESVVSEENLREQVEGVLRDKYGMPQEEISAFLEMSAQSLVKMVQEARKAVENGDHQALSNTAHTIKGAVANLGMESARMRALEIERAAKAEDQGYPYLKALGEIEEEVKLLS